MDKRQTLSSCSSIIVIRGFSLTGVAGTSGFFPSDPGCCGAVRVLALMPNAPDLL